MSKLTELRDTQAALASEIKDHGAKLPKDASDDEREQWRLVWDAKNAEYDETTNTITSEENRLAEDQQVTDRLRAVAQDARAGLAGHVGRNQPRIGNPTLSADMDNDKRGFRTPRELLMSVMDAGRTGRVDPRLNLCRSQGEAWNVVGADEQSTFSDPYGGFLIPRGFIPDLLTVMAEDDPISGLVTQIPMNNAVVDIPARTDKTHTSSVSGGLQVKRRAEADTVTATRMEIEQVTLRATSLFGLAYATEELLERSPMSFIALLEAGFRDEFRTKLMDERLNGSGVGMFEGVIEAPATISVAKETGQPAATIVKENIDKMQARCWGYDRAVWIANHDTLPQLKGLVQNVGTGGAPVAYFNDAAAVGGQSTLSGRPIFFTEFAQTLGTAGDLILGNWSQYLEGTLVGMRQAESIHVRFINHERVFKFWMENDGRNWWLTALTPRTSSDTLSPFVMLATRS